jgi:hypothetical protein
MPSCGAGHVTGWRPRARAGPEPPAPVKSISSKDSTPGAGTASRHPIPNAWLRPDQFWMGQGRGRPQQVIFEPPSCQAMFCAFASLGDRLCPIGNTLVKMRLRSLFAYQENVSPGEVAVIRKGEWAGESCTFPPITAAT